MNVLHDSADKSVVIELDRASDLEEYLRLRPTVLSKLRETCRALGAVAYVVIGPRGQMVDGAEVPR